MKKIGCYSLYFFLLSWNLFAGDENKLRVVATTSMVSDMVKSIAGDYVEVHGLMGANVDPHLYKPTAADVAELSKADIIFYNGLHLEGRMTDILHKLEGNGRLVFAVARDIPKNQLLTPEEFGDFPDPHIWFDSRMWADCTDVVLEGMIKGDPANAGNYKANAGKLKKEYLAIYEWGVKRISDLPVESRILVTSHDAYNYFGRAFNFQVIGVQGITTVSEAGLADIARTVDFIKARGVKAIFVETSVSPAAIERISKDSGAKIGGELFSDAMGVPGHKVTGADGVVYDEGTYQGMIMHNINTIVDSLK